MTRRRLRSLALLLAPPVVTVTLFLAVLESRPTPMVRTVLPHEAFRPDRCTWFCHNHGCHHTPVLPAALTSDAGAYGWTIGALYALGDRLLPRRQEGYGVANLLVFCLAWPIATYALWIIFVWQRQQLGHVEREE